MADNVKFQIRSQMAGGKGVVYHEHIGGNQYLLRIINYEKFEEKAYWVFDSRTRTIRADTKRTYAISNRQGYRFQIANYAVIRPFNGETYQKI